MLKIPGPANRPPRRITRRLVASIENRLSDRWSISATAQRCGVSPYLVILIADRAFYFPREIPNPRVDGLTNKLPSGGKHGQSNHKG
jgi:hypothetical protein